MADPRFFDNRGPFRLAELCEKAGAECPQSSRDALVLDVAGLSQAAPAHLSFFDSPRSKSDFQATRAGWCLVKASASSAKPPDRTVLVTVRAVSAAFGAIAAAFYPENAMETLVQTEPIHPTARIGEAVRLGHGVVIGPAAEIGEQTHIGAATVVGRGVTIGRGCRIGPRVSIQCAHIGDEVVIEAGATIGASGFGFASTAAGHTKIPQLGRVIIQDRAEIGANSTIDRGALADTVVGEGTKIDNLVQIGHNSRIGRHCVMAGQSGLSGSVTLGDYVVLGGKVGVADHVTIGDRVRVAGLGGVASDLAADADYGGIPARPLMQWKREVAAIAKLATARRRTGDE
jgi:UDP-3-O-[3-hydroxymyristoyl] glucosamine N-acyltransferase